MKPESPRSRRRVVEEESKAINIDTKKLKEVLNNLKGFLAGKESFQPVLSYFKMDKDKIEAFNGTAAASQKFPIGISVAVPGDSLLGVVNRVEAEQISMEVKQDTDGNYLEIRITGKRKLIGRFKIEEVTALTIPSISTKKEKVKFSEEEGKTFIEALRLCFLSSKKGFGSSMNGVAVSTHGLFSSDNLRASFHEGIKFPFDELLPYEFVKELIEMKQLPSELTYDGEKVELKTADGNLRLISSIGSAELLIERLPKHFETVKAKYPNESLSLPNGLKKAMAQSCDCLRDTDKNQWKVFVSVKKGKMILKTIGSTAHLEETLDCDWPFEGKFEANPKFLEIAADKDFKLKYLPGSPLCFVGTNFLHLVSADYN